MSEVLVLSGAPATPRCGRGWQRLQRFQRSQRFQCLPVLANGSCKGVCRARRPRPKRGPGKDQARPWPSALPVLANGSCKDCCRVRSPLPSGALVLQGWSELSVPTLRKHGLFLPSLLLRREGSPNGLMIQTRVGPAWHSRMPSLPRLVLSRSSSVASESP